MRGEVKVKKKKEGGKFLSCKKNRCRRSSKRGNC